MAANAMEYQGAFGTNQPGMESWKSQSYQAFGGGTGGQNINVTAQSMQDAAAQMATLQQYSGVTYPKSAKPGQLGSGIWSTTAGMSFANPGISGTGAALGAAQLYAPTTSLAMWQKGYPVTPDKMVGYRHGPGQNSGAAVVRGMMQRWFQGRSTIDPGILKKNLAPGRLGYMNLQDLNMSPDEIQGFGSYMQMQNDMMRGRAGESGMSAQRVTAVETGAAAGKKDDLNILKERTGISEATLVQNMNAYKTAIKAQQSGGYYNGMDFATNTMGGFFKGLAATLVKLGWVWDAGAAKGAAAAFSVGGGPSAAPAAAGAALNQATNTTAQQNQQNQAQAPSTPDQLLNSYSNPSSGSAPSTSFSTSASTNLANPEGYKKGGTKTSKKASTPPSSGTASGQDIVDYAKQFVGHQYVLGGSGDYQTKHSAPFGPWDCAGFVSQMYAHFGIQGWPYGGSVNVGGLMKWGKKTSGPVVGGFGTMVTDGTRAAPGHVVLVAGANKSLQAMDPALGTGWGDLQGVVQFYTPGSGNFGNATGGDTPSTPATPTGGQATMGSGILGGGDYAEEASQSELEALSSGFMGGGVTTTAATTTPSPKPASAAKKGGAPSIGNVGAGLKGFIKAVLGGLGAPSSAANMNSMVDWAQNKEGFQWPGGPNHGGKYNPWNTEEPMPGSTYYNHTGGSSGVQNYKSPAQGVQATVKVLNNGDYDAIVKQLKTGKGLGGSGPWGPELMTWSGGGYSTVAAGGFLRMGALAMVGETGPELVRFNRPTPTKIKTVAEKPEARHKNVQVKRSFDIVLIDTGNPVTNGKLAAAAIVAELSSHAAR